MAQDDPATVSNTYWQNHWDWFDQSYQPYYSRQYNRSYNAGNAAGQYRYNTGSNANYGNQNPNGYGNSGYRPNGYGAAGNVGGQVGNGIDARVHANGDVGTDASPVFHDGQNGQYGAGNPNSLFGNGNNGRFNNGNSRSYGWW